MSKFIENNYNEGNTESIIIDSSNTRILQQLWDRGEFEKHFNSPNYWTRITVIQGSTSDKDLVLRTILHTVHPVEVFPALYQVDGEDSFFLVRNSSHFIRKLALTSLKVSHPSGRYHFYLSITTCYLPTSLEPLNVTDQLKEALDKRYNKNARTIDLTNFSQDERLKDIFFHLNVPQCMHHVMCLLRQHFSTLSLNTLVLQHNDLVDLEALVSIGYILELDLRHNNLTWEGFGKFYVRRGMKVNAIWLDGNPLCLNISEPEYIRRIDAVIPCISKVDGVDVSNVFYDRSLIRNFLCDGSWADFVDHFLHHYFGLMESPNRIQLHRMYHEKATFTLSAYHDPEDTPNWKKLTHYMKESRNLLTLSDFKKAYSTVNIGPQEIIDVLNKLPVILYDPKSFTVDVPYSQMNDMILINVGGVFQDSDSSLFYFQRSFILTPFKKNMGEWKIENDMLSITPANQEQIRKSFIVPRRVLSPKNQLILNPTLKDREALIPTICDLTKLTKEWATRFLEEGSWDLEMTLQAFIDQLKANQIPMRAFSI